MKDYTVLFVDDEEKVLSSLRRGLIDEEYKCIYSSSAKEALEIMEQKSISVIVTDMRMPEMNGLQLLKEVMEKYPDTVRIVLSGYTQLPQMLATINNGNIFKFIPKPWKLDDEFKPAIYEALKYYNVNKSNKELKEALERKNTLYEGIINSNKRSFASFQSNLNEIKRFSKLIYNSFKEAYDRFNNNPDYFKKYLDTTEAIYSDYLNIFPANFKSFNIESLMDEVSSGISSIHNGRKINFEFKNNTSIDLNDNIGLVRLILQKAFDLMLTFVEDKGINVIISYNEDNQRVKIEWFTILNTPYIPNIEALKEDYKLKATEFQLIIKLLSKACEAFNGSMEATEVDSRLYIKLQMDLRRA